jgi:F0F1-type ATP synthase membrane subunit b/b'
MHQLSTETLATATALIVIFGGFAAILIAFFNNQTRKIDQKWLEERIEKVEEKLARAEARECSHR